MTKIKAVRKPSEEMRDKGIGRVQTGDAASDVAQTIRALESLLLAAGCSDEGINEDACYLLSVILYETEEKMKTVTAWLEAERGAA